jgi:pyruvate carboxylase subunit B
MRRIIAFATCIATLFISFSAEAAKEKKLTLNSPDNRTIITVTVGEQIKWSVMHDGKEVIAPSSISMEIESADGSKTFNWGDGSRLRKVSRTTSDRTIISPIYKASSVKEHYNQMELSFRQDFGIIFRAYDDGVAYRFYGNKLKEGDKVVEYGCDEICLKDMAGIGRPVFLGRLIAEIKKKYPKILVQYHGHSGPGFSVASMLEVARAGAEYIDVAMEPLSWGKIHPDVITIQAMLKDAGFLVKDINMDAYMEARHLTQTFIDDFLGYFIEPTNYQSSSLLVGCGLPGGMMGSMMADLQGFLGAINMSLKNQGKKEATLDELTVALFQEVEYVWPRLGYPPLVTPFSQYVKNTALMNLMHTLKGEPRWKTIDKDTMNMILGKTGTLPGELAPEIVEIVKEKGLEFYTGNPQDEFPDELPMFEKMMEEEGWDRGQDDEELFQFAMHERQYRDYKSGIAKERFERDLESARAKAGAPIIVTRPVVEMPKFDVEKILEKFPTAVPVQATVNGQLIWQYDVAQASSNPNIGDKVEAGQPVCFVQTFYGLEEIKANFDGKIVMVCANHGDKVVKGEILAFIAK